MTIQWQLKINPLFVLVVGCPGFLSQIRSLVVPDGDLVCVLVTVDTIDFPPQNEGFFVCLLYTSDAADE